LNALASLPQVLEEIAAVAGWPAAWAIADAKGGQDVFIPRRPGRNHWLSVAVGHELAMKICEHFRANHQSRVLIPRARMARASRAVLKAIEQGKTNNAAAAAAGVHERTVRRYRRRLRRSGRSPQGELF
jgi:FixJ family two-component response regulator